ncbi:MAG: competence protein ComEC family protein, partial [Ruminococcus sp.]|nr:competence protein ComEC family protein [Ruminococcus sp.]
MKRKMVGVSSAYLSGLFFASFFINIYGFIILAAVSVIVVVIAKVRNFSRFDLYIIIFSFLAAVTVSMTYTLRNYCAVTDFAGINGSFSGRVTDYKVYEGDRASYIISGIINGKQKANIIFYCYETGAEYGDIITLENCTFEEIESDYLFDTKTYYKSRHIFLSVDGAEDIDVNYTDSAKIKKMLDAFRENMISRICCNIGSDSGGFLAGMIFGEKQYLDDNTKTSLYRSGIGHVLAVSGLHVSIIASIIMRSMNKLKVNKFVGFGAVNLFLLIFIVIADCPVSAIRATIMLDIMYSASFFRRQNDSLNSIAVAALIISIAKPYSVYDSGFILSISGTFGIAVFGRYMTDKTDEKFISTLVIGICTTLSVIP